MFPRLKSQQSDDLSIGQKFKLPFRAKESTSKNGRSFQRSATVDATRQQILVIDEGSPKKEKKYDIPFNELRHRDKSKKSDSISNMYHNDFRLFGNHCKNKQCKICKKYKQTNSKQKAKKVYSVASHIDPIPVARTILETKTIKPREKIEVVDEYGRRKVVSVIQMRDEVNDPVRYRVKETPPSPIISRVVQSIPRFKTQPQIYESRLVQFNGQLYEMFENQNEYLADKKSEKEKQIEKYNSEMQQIIEYRENWKKIGEQKDKERESLNKIVNQYIKYDTVFSVQNRKKFVESDLKVAKVRQPVTRRYKSYQSEQSEKMPLHQEKQSVHHSHVDNLSEQVVEVNLRKRSYYNVKTEEEDEIEQEIQCEKEEVYTIKFPQISQIETMIDAYESLTDEFEIKQLKNTKDFTRQYCYDEGKQFLYFGGYDKTKAQRKGLGVYVTKKIILEGFWVKGNIVKGAELKNQSIYKGQFKNNKKHGTGKCSWLNGQEYTGEWVNGIRQGQGFWQSRDRTQSYSGSWKNGMVSGYGQYIKKDCYLYKGQFLDFKKNGKGKEQFPNGDMYEGSYVDGLPSGKGKYTWNCDLIYEGDFKKGMRQGKGVLYKESVFSLDGQFQNEKPNGICRLKLSNGDTFSGKYLYGAKYGFGTLSFGHKNVQRSGFWNHDILEERVSMNNQNKDDDPQ